MKKDSVYLKKLFKELEISIRNLADFVYLLENYGDKAGMAERTRYLLEIKGNLREINELIDQTY